MLPAPADAGATRPASHAEVDHLVDAIENEGQQEPGTGILDVENAGTRFLLTFVFYCIHQVIYFSVARRPGGPSIGWSWQHELWSALANAILSVFLFLAMDRLKLRA